MSVVSDSDVVRDLKYRPVRALAKSPKISEGRVQAPRAQVEPNLFSAIKHSNQITSPTVMVAVPRAGRISLDGHSNARHIGTNIETNTRTRENSSKPMIDCPEKAINREPAITHRTLDRPDTTALDVELDDELDVDLDAHLKNGSRILSVSNVACPIVEPAATARHKLNIPMMSTI